MGNVLEAPVTDKDTVRFQRPNGVRLKPAEVPQEKANDTYIFSREEADGQKGHKTIGQAGTSDATTAGEDHQANPVPGDNYEDRIAAAACSMQGWRRTMEDRLAATMDVEGCPLGVRHIFCLFDGHGGDSVAEYCAKHLTSHILERLHGATPGRGNSPEEPCFYDDAEEIGNLEERGEGLEDGPAALIASCVQEACRAVDAQVKGKFFTNTGRFVPPRVYDTLDVTPPPATPDPEPFSSGEDGKASDVDNVDGSSNTGGNGELRGYSEPTGSERATPNNGARDNQRGEEIAIFGREQHQQRAQKQLRHDQRDNMREEQHGTTNGYKHECDESSDDGRGDCVVSDSLPVRRDFGDESLSTSGTTSLVVILTDERVICCNTGDSRAILASEGASRALSTDHKPEIPSERKRIEAAGGRVEHNRVEGRLAVSRCIGDHKFKSDPRRPLDEQMVVCDPEVTVVARSETDEFVMMGCDGVWDVMGNDEACFFVRRCIQDGGRDLGVMLERVADTCLAKQSMDNISIILIAFQGAWDEGLHVHKSARYLLRWGCEEVLAWLSANDFTQYQEDFERHGIDGAVLFSLTEGDLLRALHIKKVGLRKRLWQRLSSLRLGYLAWRKKELAAWLGHINLKVFQEAFLKANIDGRALSTMRKADLRALAKSVWATKQERRVLYDAVLALRETGAGSELVALQGGLGGPDEGSISGSDVLGDTWTPLSALPHPRRPSSSSSSSSSSTSSATCLHAKQVKARSAFKQHFDDHDNSCTANGDDELPVVVGLGHQKRKMSRGSAVDGARRVSRVLLHKFEPHPSDVSPSGDADGTSTGATDNNVQRRLRRASDSRATARVTVAEETLVRNDNQTSDSRNKTYQSDGHHTSESRDDIPDGGEQIEQGMEHGIEIGACRPGPPAKLPTGRTKISGIPGDERHGDARPNAFSRDAGHFEIRRNRDGGKCLVS